MLSRNTQRNPSCLLSSLDEGERRARILIISNISCTVIALGVVSHRHDPASETCGQLLIICNVTADDEKTTLRKFLCKQTE